jgi:hypothetical protein
MVADGSLASRQLAPGAVSKPKRPHTSNISTAHPAALGTGSGGQPACRGLTQERAPHCPCPGAGALRDTSSQLNTHNTKLRDVCYPWHPWYGRSVVIHDAFVRHGQAVLRCTLEHQERSRALEIPQWMFDRALCYMMAMAEAPWVKPGHDIRYLCAELTGPYPAW